MKPKPMSRTMLARLRAYGARLVAANQACLTFKQASKKLGISIPSVRKYAKELDLVWYNQKPRGKYKPKPSLAKYDE